MRRNSWFLYIYIYMCVCVCVCECVCVCVCVKKYINGRKYILGMNKNLILLLSTCVST